MSAPASDSEQAIAKAKAWLDEKMEQLLHPKDELEGMQIDVQPPAAKLIRGSRIDIQTALNTHTFTVSVETARQRVLFAIELAGWLLALTTYIRSGSANTDGLLLMGDRLHVERQGELFRIELFDFDQQTAVWLELTRPQLLALHGRLVAELIVAAHRANGAFANLDGLKLLSTEDDSVA